VLRDLDRVWTALEHECGYLAQLDQARTIPSAGPPRLDEHQIWQQIMNATPAPKATQSTAPATSTGPNTREALNEVLAATRTARDAVAALLDTLTRITDRPT
jgi:hypothetical protein